ncbi:MAG: hypothetical protein FJY83_00245 [Candidatus Aminicenantes bacterium]|nr:hypothetical protein [Candidatus Aminicenantes bacterium]
MKTRLLLVPALLLGLTAPARAAELTLSVSAGVFLPQQPFYRQIYGSSIPLSFEAGWEFKGGFGLSAGLTALRDDGRAVAVSGEGEEYPLRFERLTVPLMIHFSPKVKGFTLRLAAGLAGHFYRERWRTVDLGFEGRTIGPRLGLAVGFPVLGRLSLFGSLIYEPLSAKSAPPPEEKVELGGVLVLGGVILRVL